MHKRIQYCGIGVPLLLLAAVAQPARTLAQPPSAGSTVTIVASNPLVPPGATAQLTIGLNAPTALTGGRFSIDFDPAVIGDIEAVNVFSATGDQHGIADIRGRHAEIQFTSETGGIGRLPELPIVEVTVRVSASAKAGTVSAVKLQSSTPWLGPNGAPYTVEFLPAAVTVGGSLAIDDVVPGGGIVPGGTQVHIHGSGFTSSTLLQIDGIVWSKLQFVNSQQIDFTLDQPAELTGKRLELRNPTGERVVYFSALRTTLVAWPTDGPLATLQPIFPFQTCSTCGGDAGKTYALENQTLESVDVTIHRSSPRSGSKVDTWDSTITIPSGGVYIVGEREFGGWPFAVLLSQAPIRSLQFIGDEFGIAGAGTVLTGGNPFHTTQYTELFEVDSLFWEWQVNSELPAPRRLQTTFGPSEFQVSSSTDDGNPWISTSILPGADCGFAGGSCVKVSVAPTSLAPGIHSGWINYVRRNSSGREQIPVVFRVTSEPLIAVSGSTQFTTTGNDPFPPLSLQVTSSGAPVKVTVGSSNRVSASPSGGTTPLTVTVTCNDPSATTPAYGPEFLTIKGPSNTQTVPLTFKGFQYAGSGLVSPKSILFVAGPGSPTPAVKFVSVAPTIQPVTLSLTTKAGENWLSASMTPCCGVPELKIEASASNLGPGIYTGVVTVHPNPSSPWPDSIAIEVQFNVWEEVTPAPTLSATHLDFILASQTWDAGQYLNLVTGSALLPFEVSTTTDDGADWLLAYPVSPAGYTGQPGEQIHTPASIHVAANSNRFPGVYRGRVVVTAPPGSANSVTIPVTLTVTPPLQLASSPWIGTVANTASLLVGAIAPGECVTLFGKSIGAPLASGINLGYNGRINTSSYGERVLFNGIPAPLLYSSAEQVNVVVPFEVAGSPFATVQVDSNGVLSAPWTVPVATSAPGIFTEDGTGRGRALVRNQDNSANTVSNPALRGSTIQIFSTGEGVTSPPGITGEVTRSEPGKPTLQVALTIGGIPAVVVSATTAPNSVPGILQITTQVPPVSSAGALPIVLTIGSRSSQTTSTLFVK